MRGRSFSLGTRVRTLMIQGTGSGVGKTWLVAGLLRILSNRGYRVAPFKAQNMSNNSFVAPEGGEIARAQAMQAECARTVPTVHMSPILLKPNSDTGAQVVIQGRVLRDMRVSEYHAYSHVAFEKAKESFSLLARRYDAVVMEGAGSPAEVNLRDHDFVNMRMAEWARAPVLLVGDIERGGVFASLYGTWSLLPACEKSRIEGFVINKLRGEAALLRKGIEFLQRKTGVPTLGVIPYVEGLSLDEEDSQALNGDGSEGLRIGVRGPRKREAKSRVLDIAVYQFPRISNFTDFRPLELEPDVRVRYFREPGEFGRPDLVVLPGTKSTLADAMDLRKTGVGEVLRSYASRGGYLLGVCGGFQILGEEIEEETSGVSRVSRVRGLGFFPMKTVFLKDKITYQVEARSALRELRPIRVRGYEIHMGRTKARKAVEPFFIIEKRGEEKVHIPDGAVNEARNVFGTYLHGLFENDRFRRSFLRLLAPRLSRASSPIPFEREKERGYNRLARVIEEHLDMKFVMRMLR